MARRQFVLYYFISLQFECVRVCVCMRFSSVSDLLMNSLDKPEMKLPQILPMQQHFWRNLSSWLTFRWQLLPVIWLYTLLKWRTFSFSSFALSLFLSSDLPHLFCVHKSVFSQAVLLRLTFIRRRRIYAMFVHLDNCMLEIMSQSMNACTNTEKERQRERHDKRTQKQAFHSYTRSLQIIQAKLVCWKWKLLIDSHRYKQFYFKRFRHIFCLFMISQFPTRRQYNCKCLHYIRLVKYLGFFFANPFDCHFWFNSKCIFYFYKSPKLNGIFNSFQCRPRFKSIHVDRMKV